MRLENYDDRISTKDNPNSTSVIYLTTAKVLQCRMVVENTIEKEETKNKTAKKTASLKVCIQQNKSEYFQRCQCYIYNISPPSR